MPPPGPRVAVTGIGLVTGLGGDRESTWAAILAGRSAARRLEFGASHRVIPKSLDDPSPPTPTLPHKGGGRYCSPSPLVGEGWGGGLRPLEERPGNGPGASQPYLGCPAPTDLTGPKVSEPVAALLDRTVDEALRDARLTVSGLDPYRTAVLIGLSKGGMRSLAAAHLAFNDPERLAALWPASWPSSGASLVARRLGLGGPCLAPVAACATGLVAALQAADLIRQGACDLALAGSVDASLEPLLLAAFRKMRVLADADDPAAAARPWDRARSGFVVGEGGAILILERLDRALARGVTPYAELAGGALGADAHHETDLNPDPTNLAGLITRALAHSGTSADELDHVNVHGTATRAGDPLECRALKMALGSHARRVACSANKSQIGHLLGAAGSVELALTCLAIRDGIVPPTLNLTDPDAACDLDATPWVARSRPIAAALKLSVGFGGHLATAVLKRPEPDLVRVDPTRLELP